MDQRNFPYLLLENRSSQDVSMVNIESIDECNVVSTHQQGMNESNNLI